MSQIPEVVGRKLADPIYARRNPDKVDTVLIDLGATNDVLRNFLRQYEGPFWSESLGLELLDIYEGNDSIRSVTGVCRQRFGFPDRLLVLTQLSAGQVLVLDTVSDEVYEVDFEGGERLLLAGELEPRWDTFRSFLAEYFGDKEITGSPFRRPSD